MSTYLTNIRRVNSCPFAGTWSLVEIARVKINGGVSVCEVWSALDRLWFKRLSDGAFFAQAGTETPSAQLAA